jgi:hypothetical protein
MTKRAFVVFSFILIFLISPLSLFAYKILYAEQFYKLYHRHLYNYPDDIMENIVWLEQALKADFANPLYALAKIENKDEWRHYRYLFKMHVNLKLVELYRSLGSRYEKRIAYFFNAPWKEQNLESLEIAEKMYKLALFYWDEAIDWAKKLRSSPHHLEDIQNWEDEKARMQTGELDYKDIIGEHLKHLYNTRDTFQKMDDRTY